LFPVIVVLTKSQDKKVQLLFSQMDLFYSF